FQEKLDVGGNQYSEDLSSAEADNIFIRVSHELARALLPGIGPVYSLLWDPDHCKHIVIACHDFFIVIANRTRQSLLQGPEWKEDSDPYLNVYQKSEMEGNELKLSCPAKGRPKPDIIWYKDNEPFFPRTSEVLVIVKATGLGYCRSNRSWLLSKQLVLLLSKQQVLVIVKATGPGYCQSNRSWLLSKQHVLIRMKGINLKFTALQILDRGNYTCLAQNTEGKVEFTYVVDVVEKIWPLEVNVSSNVTIYEGENAQFFCRVLNDRSARIQWLMIIPDDPPSHRFLQSENESPEILILHDVTVADAGQYTCLIGNEFGNDFDDPYVNPYDQNNLYNTNTNTFDPDDTFVYNRNNEWETPEFIDTNDPNYPGNVRNKEPEAEDDQNDTFNVGDQGARNGTSSTTTEEGEIGEICYI
ncbi:FGFR4-like protein, partial [Mya arenaria]